VVLLGEDARPAPGSRGRAQALSRQPRGRAAQDGALGARAADAPLIRSILVRLFFAAFPTPQIRRRIASAAVAIGLPKEARLVLPDNYHMTVAFVGDVSREQAVALRAIGAAVRCPPFEVCFDTCESWQKPEIVVAVANEPHAVLLELHRALHAEIGRLGLRANPVAFRAHITLARKVTQAPVLKPMSKFSWTVRVLQLVRSARSTEGSIYTVVDSWPLLDNAGRAP
jgi:2'-5' RNA ligase